MSGPSFSNRWSCFRGGLLDELVANLLLHRALRYQQRPPVTGPTAAEDPGLYSGQLELFYRPIPPVVDLFREPVPLERQPRPPGSRPVRPTSPRPTQSGKMASASSLDYRLPSLFQTRWPAANQIWLRRWSPLPEQDRGITLICLQGLVQRGMGWFRPLAEQIVPQGVEVVAVDLPFNFRRTPAGYFPGQLIVGGDLGHQLAVTRQAVIDTWQVVRSLQHGGRRVGLIGVSYGGWISLLTSLLADDLACVVAVTPPVNTFRLLQEGGTLIRAVRRGLGKAPLNLSQLTEVSRPLTPREWTSRLPGDRIHLHLARCDRFVKSGHIRDLAAAWGTVLREHFNGHYNVTMRPLLVPGIVRDLQTLLFG